MNRKILFISNGYGEDAVSTHIAKALYKKTPELVIRGFPTVGTGRFYKESGFELAGSGLEMPSEGFVRSFKSLNRDITNGLFIKTLRLGFSLKKVSRDYEYLIITGDPYLLMFTSLFTHHNRGKKVFIGIQQSEWYESKKPFKQHYGFIERHWMRRYSNLVFVRDEKTREYLNKKGLHHVKCVGNPMMDCLSFHEKRVFPQDREIIGILPGSKREAYSNLRVVMDIIKILSPGRKKPLFTIALSPNLEVQEVVRLFNLKEKKIILNVDQGDYNSFSVEDIDTDIIISQRLFGDILNESKIIIGLSGTGNEQAAGMGKPVFAFWGDGPQITKKFLKVQGKLLGISLILSPPQPKILADRILETLGDESLLKKIEENGRLRMAGRGSIKRMVDEIEEYIRSNN